MIKVLEEKPVPRSTVVCNNCGSLLEYGNADLHNDYLNDNFLGYVIKNKVMEQYIKKSALVAEIEKRMQKHHSGYLVCLKDILSFLNTLEVKEKPVSKDLENAAHKYIHGKYSPWLYSTMYDCFKAGAQWQEEQFEKNRLEHCDNITKEQYNLETGFIDYYLDKYHRMPTFLDAIEYGMKKAKEE